MAKKKTKRKTKKKLAKKKASPRKKSTKKKRRSSRTKRSPSAPMKGIVSNLLSGNLKKVKKQMMDAEKNALRQMTSIKKDIDKKLRTGIAHKDLGILRKKIQLLVKRVEKLEKKYSK